MKYTAYGAAIMMSLLGASPEARAATDVLKWGGVGGTLAGLAALSLVTHKARKDPNKPFSDALPPLSISVTLLTLMGLAGAGGAKLSSLLFNHSRTSALVTGLGAGGAVCVVILCGMAGCLLRSAARGRSSHDLL